MNRRLLVILPVCAMLALSLAACSPRYSKPSGGTSGTGSATGTAVSLKDFAFDPPELAVKAGTKVTWTNNDSTGHTVTGDDWDSGDLEPGKTFSRTFDKPGTYDYTCSIHPSMKGRIVVK